MKTKAKLLGERLGGNWVYDGHSDWWCDDGKRHVGRRSAGVGEWDNPLGPAQYWLYGDGTPRRAERYFYKENSVSDLLLR